MPRLRQPMPSEKAELQPVTTHGVCRDGKLSGIAGCTAMLIAGKFHTDGHTGAVIRGRDPLKSCKSVELAVVVLSHQVIGAE